MKELKIFTAKNLLMLGLLVTTIVSISIGSYYYNAWYDYEYPHGTEQMNIYRLDFNTDYSHAIDYVRFNNGIRYVLGHGMKDTILNEIDHWNAVFDYDYHFLSDRNMTYQFTLSYHTEDQQSCTSDDSYKVKVLDGFSLAGWWSVS